MNPPDPSFEVLSHNQNGDYRKLVLKDGRVVGMVFAGDIEKAGIVFSLMKNRVDVSHFKPSLVASSLGRCTSPGSCGSRISKRRKRSQMWLSNPKKRSWENNRGDSDERTGKDKQS